jgi:hypothetical protein
MGNFIMGNSSEKINDSASKDDSTSNDNIIDNIGLSKLNFEIFLEILCNKNINFKFDNIEKKIFIIDKLGPSETETETNNMKFSDNYEFRRIKEILVNKISNYKFDSFNNEILITNNFNEGYQIYMRGH